MKKILFALMMMVSVFCLAFGFAACGETENSGNTGGGSQTEQPSGSQSGNQGNQGSGTQKPNEGQGGGTTKPDDDPGVSQEKPEEPPAKETDFTFTQSGNGFSVTAYSGEAKMVVVPAEHDGKPVTVIGEKAFYDCSNITEISLPTSIKEIGEYAFGYCTSLQKIVIPNATRVRNYAFRGCGSLTEISIPSDCIELGNGAFMGCASLKKLTLNGSAVTKETLADCTSVTDLTIASSVRTIESGCLADMTSLVHLTLAQIPITLADLFGCTSVTVDNSEHEFLPERTETMRVSANGTTYVIGVPVEGTDWFTTPFTVTSEGRIAQYMGGKVEPITWMTESITLYGVRVASYQKPKTAWVKCYFVPQNFESVTVTDELLSTNSPKIEGFRVELLNKYPIKTFEVYEGNKTEFFPEKIYDEFRLHIVREDDVEEFSYLQKEDLSEADQKALEQPGEHTVTINREGKTLQATLTILASSYEINYVLGLDGVTNENPTSYITDGEDVKLKNPVRSGYEFLGWYTETEFQNKITEIKGNAHKSYTLYAKWQSAFYVNNGTITGLSYYGKQQTELIIDETINGEKITAIGNYAFSGCKNLQSITIPASVTSIGKNVFDGCSKLETISVATQNSKYSCQDGVLYDKDQTQIILVPTAIKGTVTIPANVTSIDEHAFYNRRGLQCIIWDAENCTKAGSSRYPIFEDCTNLKTVTFGENVMIVPAYAFHSCDGLQSVAFGDNSKLTSIGECAFYKCSGLKSIEIPDSVTSIGEYAFYGCDGLTSVTIGSGVTSIESSAFYDCSGLQSVTFGDNSKLTSIGGYAFYNCSGLKSIEIPDSVTSIGDGAFYKCSGLKEVHITDLAAWCKIDFKDDDANPLYYAHHLYLKDVEIKNLTIPSDIKEIKAYAFYDCDGLESVTIGSGVTSIGEYGFAYCVGLTSVTIESGSIGERAFYDCDGLESVAIGKGVTSIGEHAFRSCSELQSVTFGDNSKLTSIGKYAFEYCSGLTGDLKIPDGVTSIGEWAFHNCSGLTGDLKIPDSVTSIGEYAFYDCSELQSVTFGDNSKLTSIGSSAFDNCSGLKEVHITDLSAWCKIDFKDDDANPLYYAHHLYLKDVEIKNLTIPSDIKEIKAYAFYNCSGLTGELKISDSVTSIGESAFHSCNGMQSVAFGDNSKLTSIGECAFDNCSGLTGDLKIPDSVTSIGEYAFYNCSGLTGDLKIPDSVTSIGEYAFAYCVGLTSVTIESGSIGERAFYDCDGLESVAIGKGVTSIGECAFEDCSGLKSIEIPDGVTSIESSAFYDCSGLTAVTIGSGVTSIGNRAFQNCSGLQSVTFGDNSKLTSIGYAAFEYCRGLNSVIIPDSVTEIGNFAFDGCDELESVTIGSGVTSIGNRAFENCSKLTKIRYNGMIDAWKQIQKDEYWDNNTYNYTVYCKDGTIARDGKETYYNNAQSVSAYVAVTPRKREF